MGSHSFNLFGHNTYESIKLGYGAMSMRKWYLYDFRGSTLRLRSTDKQDFRSVALYPDHLNLLYNRFRNRNPDGTTIEMDGAEERYEPEYLKGVESEGLFRYITMEDHLGYPLFRLYLPEIFRPEMQKQMINDLWLNMDLLGKALHEGDVPNDPERDPRWSVAWRRYCDNMDEETKNLYRTKSLQYDQATKKYYLE